MQGLEKAIAKLAFEVIPVDPTRPEYRQGKTLGDEYKHWLRLEFRLKKQSGIHLNCIKGENEKLTKITQSPKNELRTFAKISSRIV